MLVTDKCCLCGKYAPSTELILPRYWQPQHVCESCHITLKKFIIRPSYIICRDCKTNSAQPLRYCKKTSKFLCHSCYNREPVCPNCDERFIYLWESTCNCELIPIASRLPCDYCGKERKLVFRCPYKNK